jgi:hypothetical protein
VGLTQIALAARLPPASLQRSNIFSGRSVVSANIPFSRPPITGRELGLLAEAIERRELSGDGHFSRQCESRLVKRLGAKRALLARSCTGALEMAAILAISRRGRGDHAVFHVRFDGKCGCIARSDAEVAQASEDICGQLRAADPRITQLFLRSGIPRPSAVPGGTGHPK